MKDLGPDYYPLVEGSVLEYGIEDAGGAWTRTVEILSVTAAEGSVKARCRRTDKVGEGSRVREFEVVKGSGWVRLEGEALMPWPARAGARWEAPPVSFEAEALDAAVEVPAGSFRDCLKVSYLVAQGDAGGGERRYAPGVGFIYEDCAGESDPFELRLVRFRIPGA